MASESADGLKFIMSFDADTKAFDAQIAKMTAAINGLGKAQVNIGSGGGGGKKGGGGSGRSIDASAADAIRMERRVFSARKGHEDEMEKNAVQYAKDRAIAFKTNNDMDERARLKKEAKVFSARQKHEKEMQKGAAAGEREKAASFRRDDRAYAARARHEKEMSRGAAQAAKEQESRDRAYKRNLAKGQSSGSDEGFFGKASALVVGMELGKAQNFAQGVAEAMWSSAQAVGQLYGKTVEEAALFQDIESGLKFAFGPGQYERVFENVKKEAIKTSFTLAETAELTRSLGMLKINPFEDSSGKALEFVGRTGEAVSALEVLQDSASATGKSTKSIQVALREFMGGNDVSLARRLDIPLTKVHEWRKETKKAKDVQGEFNILVGKLAGMYGGASAGMKDNWNFLSAQLPDIMQRLLGAMGEGALKAMTPGLKDFIASFMKLTNSDKSMKSLGEAFQVVGTVLGKMMSAAGGLVKIVTAIIELEPHTPLFVAGLLAMAGAAVFFTSTAAVMALGVGVLAASIAALGLTISAVAIVPVLLAGAVAAVAFAGGASLMTGAFLSAQQRASGFTETLTDAKVLFQAFSEAWKNWAGEETAITQESKEALDKRGLTGWFGEVIAWARRAQLYVEGVGRGFAAAFAPVSAVAGQVFDALVDNVTRLLSALGLIAPTTETSTEAAGSAGERMGARISGAVSKVVAVVNTVNGAMSSMFAEAPAVISKLAQVYFWGRLIWNVFQTVGGLIMTAFVTPFVMVYRVALLVYSILEQVVNAFQAIGMAMDGDFSGAADKMLAGGSKILGAGKDVAMVLPNAVLGNIADIDQNATDIQSASQQSDQMMAFAKGLEPALKAVDSRREQEGFYGPRREALAAPEAGYSRYQEPANFTGMFQRPIGWDDVGANPMTTGSEGVRQTQSINLTVKAQVDSSTLMSVVQEIQLDNETASGNPLVSRLWRTKSS